MAQTTRDLIYSVVLGDDSLRATLKNQIAEVGRLRFDELTFANAGSYFHQIYQLNEYNTLYFQALTTCYEVSDEVSDMLIIPHGDCIMIPDMIRNNRDVEQLAINIHRTLREITSEREYLARLEELVRDFRLLVSWREKQRDFLGYNNWVICTGGSCG